MKKFNKKRVTYKVFKFCFFFMFIIFITLYLSQKAGYYEYVNNKQMIFTQKQVERFENDVKNGKNIDLEQYITDTNKNYNTGFSKLGFKVSSVISNSVSKGVEDFFNFLIKSIDE